MSECRVRSTRFLSIFNKLKIKTLSRLEPKACFPNISMGCRLSLTLRSRWECYKCEIEHEYDFSNPLRMLKIITCHAILVASREQ